MNTDLDLSTRPTVAFVCNGPGGSIIQLAVAVRRMGCRIVRVYTIAGRWTRWTSPLLFNQTIVLDNPTGRTAFAALLADPSLVDIQCDEYTTQLLSGTTWLPEGPVGDRVRTRVAWFDKLLVSETLRQKGLAAPDTLRADQTTPIEAIEKLGLPLVVKARIGLSGLGVRIVAGADGAAAAVAEFGPGDQVFYERHIDGENLVYAAVAGPGVIVQAATLKMHREGQAATYLGPSTEIEFIDDPAVTQLGQQIIEALGCQGFVGMDILRDRQGGVWLIDLNLRSWSSLLAARRAGLDFVAGYLYSIGVRSELPSIRTVHTSRRLPVFPIAAGSRAEGGDWRAVTQFLRTSRPYWRQLGVRYCLLELLVLLMTLCKVSRRGNRDESGGFCVSASVDSSPDADTDPSAGTSGKNST